MNTPVELCKSRYLLLLEKNKEILDKQKKKKARKPSGIQVDYVDGKFIIS